MCFFFRRYSQRTFADHQTDTTETNKTDWFIFDIELPARRRSTRIHHESQMARSTEQDDRSNLVSILTTIRV